MVAAADTFAAAPCVPPRALIVEDDGGQRDALRFFVEREGFSSCEAGCLEHARRALASEDFDLLLTDLQLPDGSALELLPALGEQPAAALVLVTGHATVDTAIEALRRGALDYITKPVDLERLRVILESVRSTAVARETARGLRDEARASGRLGRLIGASAPMRRVYEQILRVAPTDATVLVTGETGTGKELVARTLHEQSDRATEPFVAVNCGAISSSLIESELFGHEKGSFTGAARQHTGVFEQAQRGTLFLDEITEMPLELQVRLLRVLETRKVQRVGGEDAIEVDVRVVAATNRDPRRAVADGRLRQDLLYRLLVFEIALPPLRERGDDVLRLAQHVLASLNRRSGTEKTLTRAASERLLTYAWPGNVRELAHMIERAFILAADAIDVEHLPFIGSGLVRPAASDGDGVHLDVRVGMSAAEAERLLTLATLDHYKQKKRAAEVLGISVKTLYNRLKSYELA